MFVNGRVGAVDDSDCVDPVGSGVFFLFDGDFVDAGLVGSVCEFGEYCSHVFWWGLYELFECYCFYFLVLCLCVRWSSSVECFRIRVLFNGGWVFIGSVVVEVELLVGVLVNEGFEFLDVIFIQFTDGFFTFFFGYAVNSYWGLGFEELVCFVRFGVEGEYYWGVAHYCGCEWSFGKACWVV